MSLQPGDQAPDFTLPTDGGGHTTLSALAGRPVVVYFYPRDDTSGCTKEAQAFTALAPDFARAGATVIGISRDTVKSHDRFKTKYTLDLVLASDEDTSVQQAYGVWVEKTMYGRTSLGTERSTFLVGKDGRIHQLWRKVKVPGHAEAVLAAVQALG
ncbi:MAG: peroxiredoxin [Myxococcales bacterium]|nr:MAG: peroxiredoxin [Myxococcales bacterium]